MSEKRRPYKSYPEAFKLEALGANYQDSHIKKTIARAFWVRSRLEYRRFLADQGCFQMGRGIRIEDRVILGASGSRAVPERLRESDGGYVNSSRQVARPGVRW